MSKQRYIRDELWSDDWVMDLDPSEKLLWVFLLTNERCNIAGIYKAVTRWVAFHTGLDTDITRKMLDRFVNDGKIALNGDWIIICNYEKHQVNTNLSVQKGIARIIDELPLDIRDFVINGEAGYRLSTGCRTLLNSTIPNSTPPNPTKPNGEDKKKKSKTKKTKSVSTEVKVSKKDPINEFIALFISVDELNYDASFAKGAERKASEKLIVHGQRNNIDWTTTIGFLPQVYRMPYFPANLTSTKPTELLRNWEKIKIYVDRYKNTKADSTSGKKTGSADLS